MEKLYYSDIGKCEMIVDDLNEPVKSIDLEQLWWSLTDEQRTEYKCHDDFWAFSVTLKNISKNFANAKEDNDGNKFG